MTGELKASIDRDGVISLCSIRVGSQLFGIDTRQIREVLGKVSPQRVPLAPQYLAGVVSYRGEVLTTVSFRALLGMETTPGASCVLVLDEQNGDERFGLMVDRVGGVVVLSEKSLERNPSTLDARSQALFDGAYRTDPGLMIRLDPECLRPSRLAQNEMFGTKIYASKGELR